MKLTKIDTGTPEVTPTPEAGLKVKSHVKAGLGNIVVAPPRTLPPLGNVGALPIFVCG